MKKLKTHFRKNGIDYTLIKRTDKIALFQLGLTSDPDGYEVSRIYRMRKHKAFGVEFEESEKISSNDQFFRDGSGSFRRLSNALRHFDKLSVKTWFKISEVWDNFVMDYPRAYGYKSSDGNYYRDSLNEED